MSIFTRTLSLFSLSVLLLSCSPRTALKSPDGSIQVGLSISTQEISCEISLNRERLLLINGINLTGDITDNSLVLKKSSSGYHKELLHPIVMQKSEVITDEYNSLALSFSSGKTLELRAYDNGVAYRWIVNMNEPWKVTDENAMFNFGGNAIIWYPHEDSFYSANEQKFTLMTMDELGVGKLASLPTLFAIGDTKVLLAESDLLDYAGMWLESAEEGAMKAVFPHYPKSLEKSGDRDEFVRDREDYIARYEGNVYFPWRVIEIARADKDLLSNTLVYQLASPSQGDFSWVKPGKAQWDWWNDWNLTGVDFTPGVNTETYRYYIDFASANGIEYVVLDEGWSQRDSLLNINPDVDVPGLIKYAAGKNVKVVLWCTWLRLDACLEEAFSQFEEWGAAAAKVDFMSRDDQPMIQYYTRVAECAARHHLLVDFHGCCKPAGLYRTWPNVITFEGVYGLEQSKGDQSKTIGPDHNVILPFTRMVAGPMDYTPGSVCNTHKEQWAPDYHSPMGMGTRCHHMAMYVIYESPLQMMCDSPSHYLEEPESLDAIKSIPTVWRKSIPLDSKVGEYVMMAREAAEGTWYIGGMTNSNARKKTISLDFLPEGEYLATIYADGPNSDTNANEFTVLKHIVTRDSTLDITLHSEGGCLIILKEKK